MTDRDDQQQLLRPEVKNYKTEAQVKHQARLHGTKAAKAGLDAEAIR